ncbi:acetylxylan esterase [Dyadobacter arcticus]|uniref:Cephalosporin-C deacetylase-like acetyl esterase n=1 Tax=Dyadobacter arcticus TaxID=1078754 RepID=A0ABX0UN94_9BACT|nr:acetylxylan esterase [Dyadobacter arcticus]NIJ53923.1 cephalosporin-C deacetylase-like acetyl esterase [Dyadobacter arcticus]
MKNRFLLSQFLFWVTIISIHAQPVRRPVEVIVSTDHDDWTYKTGEKVQFTVQVLRNGNLVKNAALRYEIGLEKLDPTIKETKTAADGKLTIDGGTLKTPGFLRCIVWVNVDGGEFRGLATAGFEPLKIQPTVPNPEDFDTFWDNAKKELAAVPMDAKMTLIPERCTEKTNVYHLNLQNNKPNVRVYGILSIPKKEGKYPALLRVPGAGVRPYYGDVVTADKDIITLEIGIHGIPVTMDLSVYTDLGQGVLNGYPAYNMDDKDRFYFKRVYLGCIRANDFLVSLSQFDGKNLAVTGGSQGGALSIITAGLDPRVKWLGAFYPALSDVTGYLQGRAGGWPHYFDKNGVKVNNTKEKLNTVSYYDVVNFARRVKVPGLYIWGFNDETCPPTSMYAVYNVTTAPKELKLYLDTGHWTYQEEKDMMNNWLIEKLKSK